MEQEQEQEQKQKTKKMNNILKSVVDLIYGTNSKRKKFEAQNNEMVLAADASKSITTKQNSNIIRGINWIFSQRSVILLSEKQIVCGNWNIPIDKISYATLIRFKSLFGGGQVLKIYTKDNKSYQISMQINDEWINQNVLDINVQSKIVKTSAMGWLMRIVLVGYLIFLLIQYLGTLTQ